MQSSYKLHDALSNLLSDYLPMPCYLVLHQAPDFGYALGPIPPRTHPLYFEVEFGRLEARFAYNRRHMGARPGKAVLASHAGMHDLFVPLRGAGKARVGTLLFGAFHLSLPTRAALWRQWCRLRGAPGADDEHEFQQYARCILAVPVLQRPLLRRLSAVLALGGEALLGRGDAEAAVAAIAKAKAEVFGRGLPWRMWHYADARRDRFNRGPYQGAALAPWDAQEFGLKRGPDSALALVVRDPAADPVEAMLQAVQLQHAVFDYCRARGGCVAGRIGSEGALILQAGSRLQARDRALDASQALSRRLGQRVVAVYRSDPGQPAQLEKVVQAAEAGLRLALARGQDLSEAEPLDADAALDGGVEALGQRLADALAGGQREQLRLLREVVGTAALKASHGRPELLRVYLRWSLSPLFKLLARRQGGSQAEGQADQALLAASSAGALVQRYASLVDELAARLERPAMGERALRLRRAAGRLQNSPESVASLDELAQDAGLSRAHFSRLFKRSGGVGFAQARLEARVAKACRLLSASPLALAAIAGECGFKNAGHFSTAFKRLRGLSPRDYRDKFREHL
jgi:AraC-like DNA-binding protein